MPDIDGLELFDRLQSITPQTDAVLITAFVSDDVANRALASGVKRVLPKPVDVPVLISTVNTLLNC